MMSMIYWEEMLDRKIQIVIKETNAISDLELSARPSFIAAIMN